MQNKMKSRPLERADLQYVHKLSNDSKIMSYWFEEPYEEILGLVELVEINLIHRKAEF